MRSDVTPDVVSHPRELDFESHLPFSQEAAGRNLAIAVFFSSVVTILVRRQPGACVHPHRVCYPSILNSIWACTLVSSDIGTRIIFALDRKLGDGSLTFSNFPCWTANAFWAVSSSFDVPAILNSNFSRVPLVGIVGIEIGVSFVVPNEGGRPNFLIFKGGVDPVFNFLCISQGTFGGGGFQVSWNVQTRMV